MPPKEPEILPQSRWLGFEGESISVNGDGSWGGKRSLLHNPFYVGPGPFDYITDLDVGSENRFLAFRLRPLFAIDVGEIQYMGHVGHAGGDTPWYSVSPHAQTLNEAPLCGNDMHDYARLEGLAVRLVGGNASRYLVRYRCMIEGSHGFTGWFDNGAYCGTRGRTLRMYRFQIAIVQI
jgi:hypothetical protein